MMVTVNKGNEFRRVLEIYREAWGGVVVKALRY
jgi:hypothetical protein